MPRSSADQIHRLRQRLIACLGEAAWAPDDLARHLRLSRRAVANHLRWLRQALPDRCRRERTAEGRWGWRLDGLPPVLPRGAIGHLDELELAALVAARGILHVPRTSDGPRTPWRGALAQALDRIIQRLGIGEAIAGIAPHHLQVHRFGVAEEPGDAIPSLLAALMCGDGVRFRYRDLAGIDKLVHAAPLRLVAIHGEWHCFAWADGRVKQYRLSRIQPGGGATVERVATPAGLPAIAPRRVIDDILASAFGATGSERPEARRRIVCAISPEALPHLLARRWGLAQAWEPAPEHGPGWLRLSFTTSGIREARHRLLGFGTAITVEGPPELVAWLHDQAATLAARLHRPGTA